MMPGAGPAGPTAAGKEKKEGPAEEAPKDKKALQPIEAIPAEPAPRRRVQLFEAHGYMRMRGDYFHRLDLGLGPFPLDSEEQPKFFRPPAETSELDESGPTSQARENDVACRVRLVDKGVSDPNKIQTRCNRRNGFASANMRLRMEPTLHVTDSVKVHATVDALDNLVLGSTPDSYRALDNPLAPIDLYTRTQLPPEYDQSRWYQDSIVVKRAYGHIHFGWGLDVKFGRMPAHWGLGIVYNDGNGYARGEKGDIVRMVDTDYGDSLDSLRLSFDFGKDRRRAHTVGISWDWAASGATTAQLFGPAYASGTLLAQEFSVEKFDNVYQASAFLLRRDSPSMLRRKLSLGLPIVNYGAVAWMRLQELDQPIGWQATPDFQTYAASLIYRHAFLMNPDVWLRVNWQTLRVELEAAGNFGFFQHRDLDTEPTEDAFLALGIDDLERTPIANFGYALEFKYGVFDDRFHVGLDQGYAMGDGQPPIDYLTGNPLTGEPGVARNAFRFNPAYMQDLLLFKELMGTVSNAAYFRPWGAFYFFQNNASARLDIGYAVAHAKTATPGNRYSYGIEIDAALRYHDAHEPIYAQIQYGVMFPLRAMDRNDLRLLNLSHDARAAQTVQIQVGIKF
jgi:uncharacterized protein (TIGR04551 family)